MQVFLHKWVFTVSSKQFQKVLLYTISTYSIYATNIYSMQRHNGYYYIYPTSTSTSNNYIYIPRVLTLCNEYLLDTSIILTLCNVITLYNDYFYIQERDHSMRTCYIYNELVHGLGTEVLHHPHHPPRVVSFCSGDWYESE